MKRVYFVVLCILSLILVSCTFDNTALLNKYNEICSAEYNSEAFGTGIKITTQNKKTLNTASYIRDVDTNGDIHLNVSNNKVTGDVYYIADKKVAYLKIEDTFIKAKNIDPMLLYSIPITGNISLDILGFKQSDKAKMTLNNNDYVYTITSNEMNEAKLIIDGYTTKVKKAEVNTDNEYLTLTIYKSNNINFSESDSVNAVEVNEDEFIAALQHLKLNGYFADGVLTMDNVNTFSISADMVNSK